MNDKFETKMKPGTLLRLKKTWTSSAEVTGKLCSAEEGEIVMFVCWSDKSYSFIGLTRSKTRPFGKPKRGFEDYFEVVDIADV